MYCLKIPYDCGKKPWVARLTGLCKAYGFERRFVALLHDYNSLHVGNNQVMCCFFLEPGEVYEVCEDPHNRMGTRYYCRVTHKDELEKIPLEEVMAAIRLTAMQKKMVEDDEKRNGGPWPRVRSH